MNLSINDWYNYTIIYILTGLKINLNLLLLKQYFEELSSQKAKKSHSKLE